MGSISKLEKREGSKVLSGTMENVYFAYTKIQSGDYKYKSKTEKEFATDVIMSEDQADELEEVFPKKSVKAIKTADFEDKYKIKPPYPDAKKQYVMKVTSSYSVNRDYVDGQTKEVWLAKGSPIPYKWKNRPKVFLKNEEGKVVDITMTTLVGNGSKGTLAFNVTESEDNGKTPKLSDILITDLVEYEAKERVVTSVFGEVEGGYNEGDGNPQQVPAERGEDKEEEPQEAPEEDSSGEDDDNPF